MPCSEPCHAVHDGGDHHAARFGRRLQRFLVGLIGHRVGTHVFGKGGQGKRRLEFLGMAGKAARLELGAGPRFPAGTPNRNETGD